MVEHARAAAVGGDALLLEAHRAEVVDVEPQEALAVLAGLVDHGRRRAVDQEPAGRPRDGRRAGNLAQRGVRQVDGPLPAHHEDHHSEPSSTAGVGQGPAPSFGQQGRTKTLRAGERQAEVGGQEVGPAQLVVPVRDVASEAVQL
eukprot:9304110-Alexandrium_andersonii.AAC.1